MTNNQKLLILVIGISIWFGVVAALLLQYVPQRQIYDQTHHDTRRIFPNSYEIEITKDAYQRAFRWVPQGGFLQFFLKPNRGLSVIAIDVNASPLPVVPVPTLIVTMQGQPVVMPIHAGWRRLFFLVRPPAFTDGYTTFAYRVQNSAIEDDRGSLGFAIHRVIVMPTRVLAIDWSWLVYIGVISVLVVGLWMRLHLPLWWLVGVGIIAGVGIHAILPNAEWYMPTAWHMLAICAYPIVLYVVRPWCRPREFSPLQMASAIVLCIAGLRWATLLGLMIVAIVYWWGPRSIAVAQPIPTAPRLFERWIMPLLVGLATIVRFWDLNNTGMGLFRDEARHGALAEQIMQGTYFVYSPWANLPAGYFYLSTIPIALFGASPFAIRFVAAVAGVITVPILAWVVRPLWGRQVALVAAALCTMSLWHISMSRMGFPISLGPMVTLLAIGAIERSMRAKTPIIPQLGWAVLCGLMMGCMTLVYHSARLMPVVIAVFGVVFAWQRRVPWLVIGRVVGVVAVFTAIAAFPILQYAVLHSYDYWRRITVTSLTYWASLNGKWWGVAHLNNLIAYAGMWFVRGDSNPRQYSFGLPQLDILAGSGFLMGIWLWWQYRRDLLTWAVGIWFVVTLLPGIFSVDAPHAWRSAENIIPTLIIAAWGIVALIRTLPIQQGYQWLVMSTIVGVLYSGGTYMAIQHTPAAYEAFDGNTLAAVQMAMRLNDEQSVLGVVSPLFKTDVGQYLLRNTKIFPVATKIPFEPITTPRQIVITNIDLPVQWDAPHFTYVAHDPWGHPAYRVLCRGDCQIVADIVTDQQTGTTGR